jgi:hypothetical protein
MKINVKIFIRYLLVPSRTSLTILVVLLFMLSWIGRVENDKSLFISYLGIGDAIVVKINNEDIIFDVNWVMLAVNCIGIYIASIVLSKLISHRIRYVKQFSGFFLKSFLVLSFISLIAAIAISKIYWGYYFVRPEPLEEFDKVVQINAVIPVRAILDKNLKYKFEKSGYFSPKTVLRNINEDPYYSLVERPLLTLTNRGLFSSEHSEYNGELSDYYKVILQNNCLVKPEPGYDRAGMLNGVIVLAKDALEEVYILMSLKGGESSNDHYPYYEFAFHEQNETGKLELLNSQIFFYDLAGFEGFEWYVFFIIFVIISALISGVLTTLVFLWDKVFVVLLRKLSYTPTPPHSS